METTESQPTRCLHCGGSHDISLKFCPSTGAPMNAGAMPQVGAEIDGKYRLTRVLGQGVLGSVFEAENKLAGRWVALRFLSPKLREDDVQKRFLDEVRTVGGIGQENIAELIDVGRTPEFGPYIVM